MISCLNMLWNAMKILVGDEYNLTRMKLTNRIFINMGTSRKKKKKAV